MLRADGASAAQEGNVCSTFPLRAKARETYFSPHMLDRGCARPISVEPRSLPRRCVWQSARTHICVWSVSVTGLVWCRRRSVFSVRSYSYNVFLCVKHAMHSRLSTFVAAGSCPAADRVRLIMCALRHCMLALRVTRGYCCGARIEPFLPVRQGAYCVCPSLCMLPAACGPCMRSYR